MAANTSITANMRHYLPQNMLSTLLNVRGPIIAATNAAAGTAAGTAAAGTGTGAVAAGTGTGAVAAAGTAATGLLGQLGTTGIGIVSTIPQGGGWAYVLRIFGYLFAIAAVILAILIIIHWTYKPIFKLQPGTPGLISLAAFDDGNLYWNKTVPATIKNDTLPIQTVSFGYTLILDIFIQNPLQFSKYPRILFSRGENPIPNSSTTGTSSDTIQSILNRYNLAIALMANTNDLIVSVLNTNNQMENVIIKNIKIQDTFRLGIVVMEKAIEVYMNGRLVNTRTFVSAPKAVTGDITIAQGNIASVAVFRNLKIWMRTLSPSEIHDAVPPMSTNEEIGGQPMSGSTC